jgi:hypothetical protein
MKQKPLPKNTKEKKNLDKVPKRTTFFYKERGEN